MNWQAFKSLKEGQFDNVNLGSSSMNDMIKRTRRNVAETIRSMIEEKEVDPNMTVAQLLQLLES